LRFGTNSSKAHPSQATIVSESRKPLSSLVN
jgi:hypothetical protein